MTELEALVFTFIDRHKAVVKAFDEGKIEHYIESLCKSYYGCACGNFHCMTEPKGITLQGKRDSQEYKLTKQDMCEIITQFLGGVA